MNRSWVDILEFLEFGLHKMDKLSDILQTPDLGSGEMYLEHPLDCQHQPDVHQAVPPFYTVCVQLRVNNDGRIVKDVAKD